jgi:hypothetical protein
MWFKKKMPDAVLRRFVTSDGTVSYADLVKTYRKEGRLWCDFRGKTLLLREDGSVVGEPDYFCKWEFI